MELECNEQLIEEAEDNVFYDDGVCRPAHTRSMGYTGEDEDFPSPSFGGFIGVMLILLVFTLLLSYGLPLLSSIS